MNSWISLCRGVAQFKTNGDRIDVALSDNRCHKVTIQETEDTYELTAIVARQKQIKLPGSFPERAWKRNRTMQLVWFRIDEKGRLIGESWLPKAGITKDEFILYVHRLAFECDRLEYLLTGKDLE